MVFKPLLAGKFDEAIQRYPALACAKIDGIRVRAENGVAIARSNKPIPNEHVQRMFAHHIAAIEMIDGEIIVGLPYSDGTTHKVFDTEIKEWVDRLDDPYDRTSGAIRRRDGKPDFTLHAFDMIDTSGTKPFTARTQELYKRNLPAFVKIVPHRVVNSLAEIEAFEKECLEMGYEGVMIRDPNGIYKQGRSSTKEGILLKLKRPSIDEAVIIGFVEEMENLNETKTNELGHTARSSHKENKRGKNRLGAFIARGVTGKFAGVTFHVGTGFTEAQRIAFWRMREEINGAPFMYEHFLVGAKNAPRFPSFKSFRDRFDLDPEVNKLVDEINEVLHEKRRNILDKAQAAYDAEMDKE